MRLDKKRILIGALGLLVVVGVLLAAGSFYDAPASSTPAVAATETPVPPATSAPATPATGATQSPPTSTPDRAPDIQATSPSAAPVDNTYYVALTGSDDNPGTESAPWRTIQHAADQLAAGGTAIVQAGEYGERVQVTRSGSAGQPIAFRARGSVSMKGFTIRASYVTISGFYITGAPNEKIDGYGVYIEGSHNTIENNHLYYNVRGGVILDAPSDNPGITSENVVRNNRIERNAITGIDLRGQNNVVEGNEIWATIQYHPDWPDPPGWVDADGIRFHGGGHTIRRNYIHDISYSQPENRDPHIDCFQTWSDDSHEAAHDILFEGNFCKNLQSRAKDENGQGFMIEGETRNLVIRNNVILAYLGINVERSVDLHIVNNTFVGSLEFTEYWPRGIRLEKCSGVTVLNNIFADVGLNGNAYLESDGDSENGLNAGYNLVWMSDGREPTGSPRPNDLWNVNPRFVNPGKDDYRLRANSPAIGSGGSLPQSAAAVAVGGQGEARRNRGAFDATPPTLSAGIEQD